MEDQHRRNPDGSLFAGGDFKITSRCFVDPLHLGKKLVVAPCLPRCCHNTTAYVSPFLCVGLRLGETFLLTLANTVVGINHGAKYIKTWNTLMEETGVKCEPFENRSSAAMGTGKKASMSLPSLRACCPPR